MLFVAFPPFLFVSGNGKSFPFLFSSFLLMLLLRKEAFFFLALSFYFKVSLCGFPLYILSLTPWLKPARLSLSFPSFPVCVPAVFFFLFLLQGPLRSMSCSVPRSRSPDISDRVCRSSPSLIALNLAFPTKFVNVVCNLGLEWNVLQGTLSHVRTVQQTEQRKIISYTLRRQV